MGYIMFKYILATILLFTTVYGQNIHILSAANLKFFFSDVIKEFNKEYPKDKVNIEFDSSVNITKNIIKGKKYDIFLAANKAYPQKVFENEKAAAKPELYATGSLIILISKHVGLKDKKINILTDSAIKEITIANKKTAPYGMAAIEALKNAGIYKNVEKKLFYSTNASNIIGDVLWYGHAGILPKSAVNFLPRGYNIEGENYIEVDQNLYKPIEQYYVLSLEGEKNEAVKRFIKFLLSDAKKIFEKNGYR